MEKELLKQAEAIEFIEIFMDCSYHGDDEFKRKKYFSQVMKERNLFLNSLTHSPWYLEVENKPAQ